MLRLRNDDDVEVSVIVPALNEAANLPQLAERVDAALNGRSYELLIVDDGSGDGTPEVCSMLARTFPLDLHVRESSDAGLSGAVMHGFARARGEMLVVMDADLQLPPERIPALMDALDEDGVELAIGSRYTAGGSTASRWGVLRQINSRVATLLARPFAGGTRDPMSGFFALRRETLQRAEQLTPLGYKIGLELLCKCRVKHIAEVPIHFAERTDGESKLTVKQQFKYLEHLSRLYDFLFPRGSPVTKFAVVTTCAWLVSLGAYLALLLAGLTPMIAAALSYPAALSATTVFHARYVRTQRAFLPTRSPWRDFFVIGLAEWAACALTALWLAARAREIHAVEVFVATHAAATATRYVLRKELLLDIRGLRRSDASAAVLGDAAARYHPEASDADFAASKSHRNGGAGINHRAA
jgi:dolichol-phosphate mannosyltransferase